MKDNNISQWIAKFAFYFVASILVIWTGTLTYGFVSSVLPDMHWSVPLFALVVFDVGMLAWLKVFLDYAEGTSQRTISLLLCLFDFGGVSLMVFAEVFTGGQQLADVPALLGEAALWGIAIWTIVNVLGVLTFHLTSPDAQKKIVIRNLEDKVFSLAMEKVAGKLDAIADRVADHKADKIVIDIVGIGQGDDREMPAISASTAPPIKQLPIEVFTPTVEGNGVAKGTVPLPS